MWRNYIIFGIIFAIIISANVNCLNVCVDASKFTCPVFKGLIEVIDEILLNPERHQIPKAVRLVFHDCVSGCNGCIDQDNGDNAGLNCIMGNARRTYRYAQDLTFFGKFQISRGDVIALFAQRAVYHSSNHPELTIPVCNFKFGRKDCTGAQDNKEIFATSLGNWKHISEFYTNNFKFSTQEVIALMGAHTLGRNWPINSGHRGPWVSFNNIVFTNQYYKNMLNKDLKYKVEVTEEGKTQWASAKDSCEGQSRKDCRPLPPRDRRVMLNADMCLLKTFNTDNNGTPDCTYDSCATSEDRKTIIERYANSEPAFKADFGAVFQKMIEHKCPDLVDPETPGSQQDNFEHYQNEKII